MSFGFSVGDLVAATNLSLNVIRQIREERSDGAIVVLSFRALQAQRIDEMQERLLVLSHQYLARRDPAHIEGGLPEDLDYQIDTTLQRYAHALRDYETLSQEAIADDMMTPKKTHRWPISLIQKKKGRQRSSVNKREVEEVTPLAGRNEKYNFRELDKDSRLARERSKASYERLWMGAFGGLALIAPMLLMSLDRSLKTSLITSSVGTILFAFALAVGARSLRGMDVLAATAAYAAVLVVFVGTSMPPIS